MKQVSLPPIKSFAIPLQAGLLGLLFLFGIVLGYALVHESAKMAFLLLAGLVGGILTIIWPEIGLLAVIIAMPLEDFNQLAGGGSLSLIKLLTLGVMGAYLLHYFASKLRYLPDRQEEMRLNITENGYILLLFFALVISDLIAINPDTAMNMTLKMIRMAIFYFLVINLIRSRATLHRVFWAMVLIGMFSAGYGLYEYYVTPELLMDMRVSGTLDDPMGFSYQMTILLPIAWYLFLHQRHWLARLLLLAGGALFLYAILLSGTRSGMMAAAGAMVLMALREKRPVLNGILIAVLMLCALLFMPDSVKSRLGLSEQKDKAAESSTERRMTYMTFGWELFLRSPLIGTGMGGFTEAYSHSDYQFLLNDGDVARIAHNMYLEILTGTGIIGIIPFLMMLIAPLLNLERLIRDKGYPAYWHASAKAIQTNLIAFLFIGFFGSAQYDKPLWLLIGLATVLPIIARRDETQGSAVIHVRSA